MKLRVTVLLVLNVMFVDWSRSMYLSRNCEEFEGVHRFGSFVLTVCYLVQIVVVQLQSVAAHMHCLFVSVDGQMLLEI